MTWRIFTTEHRTAGHRNWWVVTPHGSAHGPYSTWAAATRTAGLMHRAAATRGVGVSQ